jgi:hypothetical protein
MSKRHRQIDQHLPLRAIDQRVQMAREQAMIRYCYRMRG